MNRVIPFGALVIAAFVLSSPHSEAQSSSGPVFKGDLRFRHETVDQENADSRSMERIRARVNLTAKASETVSLVFGVATGQTNEPISANQNLTGGFSDKSLWIDLMYFDWTAGKKWLHVTGGKIKNPFYSAGRNQLVWDQDVNPEGFGVQISQKKGAAELFANGAFYWVEERATEKDSHMAGIQAGIKAPAGGMDLVFGGGFLDYLDTKGFPTFCDATKSYGNSVDPAKKYLYDYRIAQLFGELGISKTPAPVLVFAELANNVAKDVKDDTAWILGLNVGKLKKPGSWMARWQYQYTERDAVVGAFTNSDFGGSGTDVKGHAIGADVQVTPQITASATYYINKRGVKNGFDYDRFQADMTFRF